MALNLEALSGGMQMDLLWTNPDPTETFSAQTVSLDLSLYDLVLVRASVYYTSVAYVPEVVGRIGERITLIAPVWINSADTGVAYRYANITSTGVSFETAQHSTDNEHAIPQEIYGIKL